MKVRLTDRAQDDQDAIYDYLVERSPTGALHVMMALERAFHLLSDHPRLGRPTSRGSLRELALNRYPYRIFYSIHADRIDVIHIRHSARRSLSH